MDFAGTLAFDEPFDDLLAGLAPRPDDPPRRARPRLAWEPPAEPSPPLPLEAAVLAALASRSPRSRTLSP